MKLRISELFYSLQGETKTVGIPTVFVRLTGCPLRCQYCDTAYAFQGGTLYSVEEIVHFISQYKTSHVTVTGGEPLAQKLCFNLLKTLCDLSYTVSLETSGALSVQDVDPRVIKIIDIKTPTSLEVERNHWENFQYLLPHDQIKIVICNEEDYVWAKKIVSKFQLQQRCDILFSPSYHDLSPRVLADWIVRDQLPVRLQIQLHKFLWGDVKGR